MNIKDKYVTAGTIINCPWSQREKRNMTLNLIGVTLKMNKLEHVIFVGFIQAISGDLSPFCKDRSQLAGEQPGQLKGQQEISLIPVISFLCF